MGLETQNGSGFVGVVSQYRWLESNMIYRNSKWLGISRLDNGEYWLGHFYELGGPNGLKKILICEPRGQCF